MAEIVELRGDRTEIEKLANIHQKINRKEPILGLEGIPGSYYPFIFIYGGQSTRVVSIDEDYCNIYLLCNAIAKIDRCANNQKKLSLKSRGDPECREKINQLLRYASVLSKDVSNELFENKSERPFTCFVDEVYVGEEMVLRRLKGFLRDTTDSESYR